MTSQTTTIYTPFADGRTVRDIVEHTPALVNETWCRDLLRHTLDSLERQYATGAPHRPLSPDTIVMLANNEPLLLPAAEEVGAAGAPGLPSNLPADLHALALVVHYAITAELPPDGPLGPRLYDNYSNALTNGIDRCLGPNLRLRPKTVDDMRLLLGIEAGRGDEPVHASTVPEAASQTPVQPAQEVFAPQSAAPAFAQSTPLAPSAPMHSTSAPVDASLSPALHAERQRFAASADFEPASPPDVAPGTAGAQDVAPTPDPEELAFERERFAAPEVDVPPPQEFTAPATPNLQDAVPAPAYSQPVPDPVMQDVRPAFVASAAGRIDAPAAAPRPHTPSTPDVLAGAAAPQAASLDKRAALPQVGTTPATAPGSAPAAEPLLRTPASPTTDAFAAQGATGAAAPARQPTALEAATAARLHEEAARTRSAPAPAPQPRPAQSSVRRWGWIAGAAVVLLAAGSALVSFLQQSDSRDMVTVPVSAGEGAASGLEPGETVVPPRAEVTDPPATGEVSPGAAIDPAVPAVPGAAPGGLAPNTLPPTAVTVPGRPGDAVVNGTTYKLVIKPWGTIYVDGIDRGVSPPVKRLTLGKGLHTIQIVNPNFPEHVLTVDSGTQESTTIQHDFTAKAE